MNAPNGAERSRRPARRAADGSSWAVLAALMALVAAFAAACGDDEDEASDAASSAAAAGDSVASQASEAVESAGSQAESVMSEVESAVSEATEEATEATGRGHRTATDAAHARTPRRAAGPTSRPAPAVNDDYSLTLKDGSTFPLADRIKAKLAAGEPINYVFRTQSSTIQLFSQQYQAGFEATPGRGRRRSCRRTQVDRAAASRRGRAAADRPDPGALDTDSIDCLSIEPPDSNAFTPSPTSDGGGHPGVHRGCDIQRQRAHQLHAGAEPQRAPRRPRSCSTGWRTNGKDLKVFAVSGGDPTPSGARAA